MSAASQSRWLDAVTQSGFDPLGALLEYFFGLDREAKRDIRRAVENLDEMVADQTAEFAFGPRPGNQFDPAIAGGALGTGDV
jgi:hypothetical protein